jgi:hypothetical protein
MPCLLAVAVVVRSSNGLPAISCSHVANFLSPKAPRYSIFRNRTSGVRTKHMKERSGQVKHVWKERGMLEMAKRHSRRASWLARSRTLLYDRKSVVNLVKFAPQVPLEPVGAPIIRQRLAMAWNYDSPLSRSPPSSSSPFFLPETKVHSTAAHVGRLLLWLVRCLNRPYITTSSFVLRKHTVKSRV